jgi:hypothetical protein
MITKEQYFSKFAHNETHAANAEILLNRVNLLIDFLEKKGVKCPINPKTFSQISGTQYGGFRPQECPIGSAKSSHKTGMGVDVFDPNNSIDLNINDKVLEQFDLYREHPSATNTWCHLTTRAPGSKKRSFMP